MHRFDATNPPRMFETLLNFFQDSPLSLWGPFFVLLLCGLGLPIPEDVVLIVAGVLAEIDGRSWIEVSALMYAGVLAGDSLTFIAGRHVGGWVLTSAWFQRIFSPAKQAKVEGFFERHHSTGLFLARFLPGLRAPLFFTAGSMKVSYWKFLFFDGLAALISVPVFVWLGHWLWARFHDDVEQLNRTLARTHDVTLWVVGLIVVLVLGGLWIWRRRRRAARDH